jgi:hypothetical protein
MPRLAPVISAVRAVLTIVHSFCVRVMRLAPGLLRTPQSESAPEPPDLLSGPIGFRVFGWGLAEILDHHDIACDLV